ncbi:type I-F CRISPR-associated protein Csy3 [Tepidimonas charontis]|nr:type I-F CRISPR-associated protein Csy3 [Tepidimonas charontis]
MKSQSAVSCSFQRGMLFSDAKIYNVIDGARADGVSVFSEQRRKLVKTDKYRNRYAVDSVMLETAKTDFRASGIDVTFTMRTLLLEHLLFACNDNAFRTYLKTFIDRFADSEEMRELCRRYARNILNGRWLWRNRLLGKSIAVSVKEIGGGETMEVDALSVPLTFESGYSDAENKLAEWLFIGFTQQPMQFEVCARIDFGMTGAIEVFPSQNFVSDKPDGFARSLYKLKRMSRQDLLRIMRNDNADTYAADIVDVGVAAIRDHKIGNAIRTIDTWYAANSDASPIPVEPRGANIERDMYMRASRNDLFTYLTSLDDLQRSIVGINHEAAFVLACMIRGFLAGEIVQAT